MWAKGSVQGSAWFEHILILSNSLIPLAAIHLQGWMDHFCATSIVP